MEIIDVLQSAIIDLSVNRFAARMWLLFYCRGEGDRWILYLSIEVFMIYIRCNCSTFSMDFPSSLLAYDSP